MIGFRKWSPIWFGVGSLVIAIPNNTRSVLAAKAATQTIPIVFAIGTDPVAMGLVASLSHPGNNLTGVAAQQIALTAKRLELLHELVPTASSIAMLVNPGNPSGIVEADAKEAQQAARALGVDLLVLKASNSNEIDAAFTALVQQQAGALLITTDVFYLSRTDQIVALAARHAVPTAVLRQPRQCGEDVLRMFVTGGPPAPHAKRIDAASSLESTPARRR